MSRGRAGTYRSERRYGEFYREIPLPQGVIRDDVKAQFRNGVLEVTVPIPATGFESPPYPAIQSGESSTASAAAAGGQKR